MKHIDCKFFNKFWAIMTSMKRENSKIYSNLECQRDIFTQRVSKKFLKPGFSRLMIADKIYIIANPEIITFSYEYSDKIQMRFLSATTGKIEFLRIQRNEGLKVSFEEITEKQFHDIYILCNGTIHEKFMNAYSSTKYFFSKHEIEIKRHPLTRKIFKLLTAPKITGKKLEKAGNILVNSGIWLEDGFYITTDKKIRKNMPSGHAYSYLNDIKLLLSTFGYFADKRTSKAA